MLRDTAGSIRSCTQHALFWLVLANAVGLLLALLQLKPELNDALTPFTYGRWMPLHQNWQLYGWLSLPLIGLLFRLFPLEQSSRWSTAALWAWSLALGFGGWSWLQGQSSGKLFLDWHGPALLGFCAALTLLWLALVERFLKTQTLATTPEKWIRGLTLLALAPVPLLIFFSAQASVYPTVNPITGGATGSSLLGSTLVVVFLFLGTPYLISKPRRPTRVAWFFGFLLLHLLLFASLAAGNHSSQEPSQKIALSSLILWIPLLAIYYQAFEWSAETRLWRWYLLAWSALLVISGSVVFATDLLSRWKFTHALVGHAHLAMAGAMTSYMFLIILASDAGLKQLSRPIPLVLWHLGLLAQLLALTLLGHHQAEQMTLYIQGQGDTQGWLWTRFWGGVLMFAASVYWFRVALKPLTKECSMNKLFAYMLAVGGMDTLTGLLLVGAPTLTLGLMGIDQVPQPAVFLSWIGVFVGATGLSYGLPFLTKDSDKRKILIWGTLRFTALVRLAIGTFVLVKIASGDLAMGWITVACADLTCAIVQWFWSRVL